MLLAQLVINGLVAGVIYSLMAIGFALIFNSTRIFHIAHGAVFGFGAYAFYILVSLLGLPYLVAAPIAVVAAGTLGAGMEVVVYRPVRQRGGGGNAMLIASIGMIVLLQAAYALVFSTDALTVREGALPVYNLGGLAVTPLYLLDAAVVVVAFAAVELFLRNSVYGKAIRALADNPGLAVAQGIDADRLYLLIFFTGSVFAGLAGVLVSLDVGVQPEMGFTTVFIAIVAVVIGGVGYLPGALFGSFLLGLLQNISTWKVESAWENGIVFAALLVFLVIRPRGLFGGRLKVRDA